MGKVENVLGIQVDDTNDLTGVDEVTMEDRIHYARRSWYKHRKGEVLGIVENASNKELLGIIQLS